MCHHHVRKSHRLAASSNRSRHFWWMLLILWHVSRCFCVTSFFFLPSWALFLRMMHKQKKIQTVTLMVFEMYSNRCRKCSKTIKPDRNLGSLCQKKKKIFWNIFLFLFTQERPLRSSSLILENSIQHKTETAKSIKQQDQNSLKRKKKTFI